LIDPLADTEGRQVRHDDGDQVTPHRPLAPFLPTAESCPEQSAFRNRHERLADEEVQPALIIRVDELRQCDPEDRVGAGRQPRPTEETPADGMPRGQADQQNRRFDADGDEVRL